MKFKLLPTTKEENSRLDNIIVFGAMVILLVSALAWTIYMEACIPL